MIWIINGKNLRHTCIMEQFLLKENEKIMVRNYLNFYHLSQEIEEEKEIKNETTIEFEEEGPKLVFF